MPLRENDRPERNQISAEELGRFGRYQFLDSKLNGTKQQDSLSWVMPLASLTWGSDPTGRPRVIAELHRHVARGEWEKVGAWKFVREFMDEAPDTRNLIDGGLLAVARMRVTNLAVNLAPVDTPRYEELTGDYVPHDGFFGPPAFDSPFGPARQFYLDDAAAAAARRNPERLRHVPGVTPGPVDEAARSMWGLGQLVYRGRLVVNPDIAFEPSVVHPAVAAAAGVDHVVFLEMLTAAIRDPANHFFDQVWPVLGGSRFAEDYLCTEVQETPAFWQLLNSAVSQLIWMGEPGLMVAPEVLTPVQRKRLEELRPEGQRPRATGHSVSG